MNTINWKNATPEQINLWNLCNGLIAWTTITPIFYEGGSAGSEFLVYNAGKLYIVLNLIVGNIGTAIDVPCYVQINGLVDAILGYYSNPSIAWNVTTVKLNYAPGCLSLNNIYFSKIALSGYSCLIFNGYRLDV